MSNEKKKCVLAYSGGLDTSAIVVWLKELGYEIHAVLVDVGQDEDLDALCAKALRLGAATAQIADAKPAMYASVIPYVLGLASTYEGNYRLGTALARPFIALEQIKLAKKLGGATLVHGATGKGNDQIRFEFAYRSLAPECPVLAPWKTWDLGGRQELADYLKSKGFDDAYEVNKEYSLDENLWHLSVEGGPLEKGDGQLDVMEVLQTMAGKFATGGTGPGPSGVSITFKSGVPVALNGKACALPEIVTQLNRSYRQAPWAWDLVLENRATGIKSRGVYVNPAAKLLHIAVDGLARSCLNKPLFDQYVSLGEQYGTMLYRGEYFSDQRVLLETAAGAILKQLNGTIRVTLEPAPYVSKIEAEQALFRLDLATFEDSDYDHHDAEGFIKLSWLSLIGRPFTEETDANTLATGNTAASDVCADQPVASGGLVSAPV